MDQAEAQQENSSNVQVTFIQMNVVQVCGSEWNSAEISNIPTNFQHTIVMNEMSFNLTFDKIT